MDTQLEHTNKLIDLAFEDMKPMEYEKCIDELKQRNSELLNALIYFTDRVEAGTIKSKTTYMKFKALISKNV